MNRYLLAVAAIVFMVLPVSPRSLTPAGALVASASAASVTSQASPVEIPSLRTRTSRTYLENGQYQDEIFSEPINYQDSQGAWLN